MHANRTNRTRPRRPLGLPAALALVAVLSGCVDAGGAPSGPAEPGEVRAQAEPVWREYARCVRANGYPDLPDPVVADDGVAGFPGDAGRLLKERHGAAVRACQPILGRLPAGASAASGAPPRAPTPEQVTQLRRFARCMREHGVPDWPDPNSDGLFPLSDTLSREGKSPRILAARQRCNRLNPDAGKRIVFADSGAGGGKPTRGGKP